MSSRLIFVLGILSLVLYGFLTKLSASFLSDGIYTDRPLITLVITLGLLFALYGIMLKGVSRCAQSQSKWGLLLIVFFAIAFRMLLIFSHPIQEDDMYRYIWDGQTLLAGESPYADPPDDRYERVYLSKDKNGNLTENLDSKDEKLSEPAHDIYRQINYSFIRTIYPPVAQYLFALSQLISPWELTGWRFLIALADIGIIFLLLSLLKTIRKPASLILIYAWSPLILKEYFNSLHLDIFAIFFVTLAIWFRAKGKLPFSYLALSLGIFTKWYPLIFLPFFFVADFKGSRIKTPFLGIVLPLLLGIVLYYPLRSDFGQLTEGLSAFALHWKVNDSVFSVIKFVFDAWPLPNSMQWTKLITGVIWLWVYIGAILYLNREKSFIALIKVSFFSVSALFFLSPTGNPWYFAWVFPFLVLMPIRSLLFASGLILLYYLDFYFLYRNQMDSFSWVRFVEYGPIFIYMGYEIWKNKKYRSFCRS